MDGYYKTELPNGYVVESLADDFDREYFTGDISKDGESMVNWITKIKVIGDSILGEKYDVSETPGSEYYFLLDTKNGNLNEYESMHDAIDSNPMIYTDLSNLEDFYYKSWKWVIPLGLFAFITASGLVLISCIIVKRIIR